MSILHFCFQQFQAHLHVPYKLWQHLFKVKKTKDWGNIFTVIELCMCTPCSKAALERFFSQMRIVKTDWRNCLLDVNLTRLLRIKVAGPLLKSFHDNYCHLAINLWFNAKRQTTGTERT